jgi:hypothetical protein
MVGNPGNFRSAGSRLGAGADAFQVGVVDIDGFKEIEDIFYMKFVGRVSFEWMVSFVNFKSLFFQPDLG